MKNLNSLAKAVTEVEGKKQSISIAQVKEVLGIVADIIELERSEHGISATIGLLVNSGEDRAYRLARRKK